MEQIRVSLDQKDFLNLISGGVVEKENVKIILKDIGYPLMQRLLDEVKKQ